MPRHSLLARQIKQFFNGTHSFPQELQGFFDAVGKAYRAADEDRSMLERSLDLSSQELLQANSEMRAVVQAFPDIFFLLNSDGTILDYKGGSASEFYIPPEKLVGKRIQDIPLGAVGRQFDAAIQDVGQGRTSVSLEYALQVQDRDDFYEARLVPLHESQILVIVRNISDRKRAEEAISARNRELLTLHKISEIVLSTQSLKVAFQEIVERIKRATGFSYVAIELYDEARQQMVFEALAGIPFPLEDGGKFEVPVDETLSGVVARTGKPLVETNALARPEYANAMLRRLGVQTFVCVPMLFNQRVLGVVSLGHIDVIKLDGHLVHWAASMANHIASLLERKRTEEALTLFRSLIDHTNDAIEVIDPETGRFLDVNEQACLAHGYTREEYLTLTVPEIDPLVAARTWEEAREAVRHSGARIFESQHRRKDGSIFPVEVNITYICLDRDYLLAVVRDITERKRGEDALRESIERFELTVQGSRDGLWDAWVVPGAPFFNPRNPIHYSPRFKELLGYADDEFENVIGSWASRLHPEDRERVFTALRDHLERRVPYDIEYRTFTKSGECRWFAARGQAIWDQGGQPLRMSGSFSDITERKRLEEQFRQAQKMEAVGQLAGGVAHDFNNILTAILGYSGQLLRRIPEDARVRHPVEEICKAAERAAGLTQQLLAFSRRQVLQPKSLDLNSVVTNMVALFQQLIGEQITLEAALDPTIGAIKADQVQLEQVLVNLAVNARDAMPKGGTLALETASVGLDVTAASRLGCQPGPYVRLTVRDTGCGMDTETQSRCFEPFFTTKPIGKGTGLGLATVYGIVQQSGGTIEIESRLGQGTSFRIYLPRASHRDSAARAPVDAGLSETGTETILLVEDAIMLRELIRDVLQESGYVVLEATGVEDALRLGKQPPSPLHLLLTDVVMPGMNGRELAQQLIVFNPQMKVLYMSGYTDDAIVQHGVLEEGIPFLQKPFTPVVLERKVREVLTRSPEK